MVLFVGGPLCVLCVGVAQFGCWYSAWRGFRCFMPSMTIVVLRCCFCVSVGVCVCVVQRRFAGLGWVVGLWFIVDVVCWFVMLIV